VSCINEMVSPVFDRKCCLIVDDSPIVRKILRRVLEGFDFTVDEAVDGQLGLEACGREMPAVILLDWNMPVMDGIDFLRALRQVDGGDAPVVIFCTTVSDIGRIHEALDAGANGYIIKPFDSEILREKFGQLGLI
jgi:two-component system chemotaxis response regulator CheY